MLIKYEVGNSVRELAPTPATITTAEVIPPSTSALSQQQPHPQRIFTILLDHSETLLELMPIKNITNKDFLLCKAETMTTMAMAIPNGKRVAQLLNELQQLGKVAGIPVRIAFCSSNHIYNSNYGQIDMLQHLHRVCAENKMQCPEISVIPVCHGLTVDVYKKPLSTQETQYIDVQYYDATTQSIASKKIPVTIVYSSTNGATTKGDKQDMRDACHEAYSARDEKIDTEHSFFLDDRDFGADTDKAKTRDGFNFVRVKNSDADTTVCASIEKVYAKMRPILLEYKYNFEHHRQEIKVLHRLLAPYDKGEYSDQLKKYEKMSADVFLAHLPKIKKFVKQLNDDILDKTLNLGGAPKSSSESSIGSSIFKFFGFNEFKPAWATTKAPQVERIKYQCEVISTAIDKITSHDAAPETAATVQQPAPAPASPSP